MTLGHHFQGPSNAAPSFVKALLLKYTCGCDGVAFSVFGAKDGTLPLACCVLHPVPLLLSMFKAAPNTIYETKPYSFPIEQYFLRVNEFSISQF